MLPSLLYLTAKYYFKGYSGVVDVDFGAFSLLP